jgi:host factor-I protein
MTKNYQDAILSVVRRENIPVTIYLTSGFQIRGYIRAFDNYVIVIDSDGKQQMVYKHAVSTVAPARPVTELNNQNGADA